MKTAIEYTGLFGEKEMIYKFNIGDVVNTQCGLKTIAAIIQGDNIAPYDTFFMKEDCTDTRCGYYSCDFKRRDLTPIE